MSGVALNGSNIVEVVKPNHVTYKIETWQMTQSSYCRQYDDFGNCVGGWTEPQYDWVASGNGSTGAKIKGKVVVSSSKIKLSGNNIATVGDETDESWIADPPVPSSNGQIRYINIIPGISGTGRGRITGGSSKAKLNGKAIALIGSQVTTHLGTTTTIQDGNTKINMPS